MSDGMKHMTYEDLALDNLRLRSERDEARDLVRTLMAERDGPGGIPISSALTIQHYLQQITEQDIRMTELEAERDHYRAAVRLLNDSLACPFCEERAEAVKYYQAKVDEQAERLLLWETKFGQAVDSAVNCLRKEDEWWKTSWVHRAFDLEMLDKEEEEEPLPMD